MHYENIKENPHVICIIVSIVLLIASLLNLHSAGFSEDYIQTTGEITNVEEESKLVRGTRRYEYDFDVFWEMDGRMYEKHFDDQLDYSGLYYGKRKTENLFCGRRRFHRI